LAPKVQTGKLPETVGAWVAEGIGEDFVPPNCDLDLVSEAIVVDDREGLTAARDLLRLEGILAGSSSGTLLAAALRYCRQQREPQRVVTLVCDSGNKYLSKMFNDYWMVDQGFLDRPTFGDLRDLITRRAAEHAVVSVAPDDTLLTAYGRMRMHDVSQLPVLDGERIVGIIDESDLLLAVYGQQDAFKHPVRDTMEDRLETVAPSAPLADLLPIFRADRVAIVADGDTFHGLITRVDLLNYLRRRVA
jgi:cystathionine beta-synthase